MKKPVWTHTVRIHLPVYHAGDSVPVDVEIAVDWQALAMHLGRKAAQSKSRKSKIQGGIITASIRDKTS